MTSDTIYINVLSPPCLGLALLPVVRLGAAAEARSRAADDWPEALAAGDVRAVRAPPPRTGVVFLAVVLRALSLCVINSHVVFEFLFKAAVVIIPE